MSCLPSCVIPCSRPMYGLGSSGMGGGICGGGLMGGGMMGGGMMGGGMMGGGMMGSGMMGGGMMAGGLGGVSSSSLGTLAGAAVSCTSQLPPSEVVIQPPSYVMTIPGPILSSSCEPLRVGGYSPCASGGGMGGGMGGSYGGRGSFGGYLGSGICGAGMGRQMRMSSTCGSPC